MRVKAAAVAVLRGAVIGALAAQVAPTIVGDLREAASPALALTSIAYGIACALASAAWAGHSPFRAIFVWGVGVVLFAAVPAALQHLRPFARFMNWLAHDPAAVYLQMALVATYLSAVDLGLKALPGYSVFAPRGAMVGGALGLVCALATTCLSAFTHPEGMMHAGGGEFDTGLVRTGRVLAAAFVGGGILLGALSAAAQAFVRTGRPVVDAGRAFIVVAPLWVGTCVLAQVVVNLAPVRLYMREYGFAHPLAFASCAVLLSAVFLAIMCLRGRRGESADAHPAVEPPGRRCLAAIVLVCGAVSAGFQLHQAFALPLERLQVGSATLRVVPPGARGAPRIEGFGLSPDGKWLWAATAAHRSNRGGRLAWNVGSEGPVPSARDIFPRYVLMAEEVWDTHEERPVILSAGRQRDRDQGREYGASVLVLDQQHARAAACNSEGFVTIWDVSTGETLTSMASEKPYFWQDRELELRGERLCNGNVVVEWRTGKSLHLEGALSGSIVLSPDGKLAAAVTYHGFTVWNADSGLPIARFPSCTTEATLTSDAPSRSNAPPTHGMDFDVGSRPRLFLTHDRLVVSGPGIRIFDIATKALVADLPHAAIHGPAESARGLFVALEERSLALAERSLVLFNLPEGRFLGRFYVFYGGEWCAVTDGSRYNCSPKVEEMYVHDGHRIIPIRAGSSPLLDRTVFPLVQP